MDSHPIPGSFRDPSGFLFIKDEILLRQINHSYQADWELLEKSGLRKALLDSKAMVAFTEEPLTLAYNEDAYKIIRPEVIPLISYPYEWCFSQLQAAALHTMAIQKIAIQHGMILKDSSVYNVQFNGYRPVFIDTLSFTRYTEGEPWVAYRQFCQHFLAPLALMAMRDVRLGQLFRNHIDGIPLDLAATLLPGRSKLSLALMSHIHLHAKSQSMFAQRPVKARTLKMSKIALLGLIDNLESKVRRLRYRPGKTEWGDYYAQTNYSESSADCKQTLLGNFIQHIKPRLVWDFGANSGVYSRIAARHGASVASFDIDFTAIEKNYRASVSEKNEHVLPLFLDLTNPSPAIGWAHNERMSLVERGPVDMALALALLHHLAIGNNLPMQKIALFFSRICRWLVIEFIPKTDSQIERMLASREDVFPDYTQSSFERVFGELFTIHEVAPVEESQRTLYCMRNKNSQL
jgi:hypothetical protein